MKYQAVFNGLSRHLETIVALELFPEHSVECCDSRDAEGIVDGADCLSGVASRGLERLQLSFLQVIPSDGQSAFVPVVVQNDKTGTPQGFEGFP